MRLCHHKICNLIPLLVLFVFAHGQRQCSLRDRIPFTGYKLEAQIRPHALVYHLLLCKDNKIIFDADLTNTIPWAHEVDFGTSAVTMARRKTFAKRKLPLFFPGTWVGAIYSDGASFPLVAENIFQHWYEVDYLGAVVHHVPLLSTTRIDSIQNRYSEKEWDRFVSRSENYSSSYDSRSWLRKEIDGVLESVEKHIKE